jgi:hypothetical protein
VAVFDRERPEDDRIHHAKDGRVDPDAEGQCKDGSGGERGSLPQRACGVTNLTPESTNGAHASDIAAFFLKVTHGP